MPKSPVSLPKMFSCLLKGENSMRKRNTISDERRENELISLAIDCAEEQLRNGTASAQVITHYLKLGAMREREKLERENLREKNALLRVQKENLESSKRAELLYEQVIDAMQEYGGVRNGKD